MITFLNYFFKKKNISFEQFAMNNRVLYQDEAVKKIGSILNTYEIIDNIPKVIVFSGACGVGKTYLAKCIQKYLSKKMISIENLCNLEETLIANPEAIVHLQFDDLNTQNVKEKHLKILKEIFESNEFVTKDKTIMDCSKMLFIIELANQIESDSPTPLKSSVKNVHARTFLESLYDRHKNLFVLFDPLSKIDLNTVIQRELEYYQAKYKNEKNKYIKWTIDVVHFIASKIDFNEGFKSIRLVIVNLIFQKFINSSNSQQIIELN